MAGSRSLNHALMTRKVKTTDMIQYTVDNVNIVTIVTKSIVRDRPLDPLELFHQTRPQVERNLLGRKNTREFLTIIRKSRWGRDINISLLCHV